MGETPAVTSSSPPNARTEGKLTTKDKTAAAVQITAEQLLRESAALQRSDRKPAERRLVDEDELHDYRVRKRKDFEDQIRRRRFAIAIWLQYGRWEAEQHDFRRARSVYERALEIEVQNTDIWNQYLDMEIKHQFINYARNLLDRVVHIMPRMDHFWLRYTSFEEALQMYDQARDIYERWMAWKPEDSAWMAYVRFEERHEEFDKARVILERFLTVHPRQSSFLKFAKWEIERGNWIRARASFEKAMEVLPIEQLSETFYLKFAQFEEHRKEHERAKSIYLRGLEVLGRANAVTLESAYLSFQKRLGARSEVDEVVVERRRRNYLEKLESSGGYDYDVWFSLIRLEQDLGRHEEVRRLYEKAFAKVPPVAEKSKWKRYFYICLNYAIFEELDAGDSYRASLVWTELSKKIPHKLFSFAKFWKLWAHFEVRQGNLQQARLIFGRGIGEYPVEKIFRAYCNMEMRLGELERARKILAKFIECDHKNPRAWLALIDLELFVKETDRARRLFEQAIARDDIENSELLWKSYIDVEANLRNLSKSRLLFERLFDKSGHWKVLHGLAEFEINSVSNLEGARSAFKQGISYCKQKGQDAGRAALLEGWYKIELEHGTEESAAEVAKLIPSKVKKRRTIVSQDGSSINLEEYTAYIFPDDFEEASNLTILQAAKNWKKRMQTVT